MMMLSRMLHGGSWFFGARFVRCAYRIASSPGTRVVYYGFRPVAEVKVKKKGKKS